MKRLTSALIFSCLLISIPTFADSYDDGAQGALNGHHQTLQKLTNVQLGELAQTALNNMVREGNQLLVENGYPQEAAEAQSEWDLYYSEYYTSEIQTEGIGDHQPLNAWLADYYKKLQFRLGNPILAFFHLDDLNLMNYATPVVLQPKGDRRNGDHWNRSEYKTHFVAFAGVVTYWSAYIGCRVATKAHPAFKKYCSLASVTLKNLMKSTFAPKMSDAVYTKATGHSAEIDLNLDQCDLTAAQQLAQVPRE